MTRKEMVQEVYVDLCNDENWIVEYRKDPESALKSYGLDGDTIVYLEKILEMF